MTHRSACGQKSIDPARDPWAMGARLGRWTDVPAKAGLFGCRIWRENAGFFLPICRVLWIFYGFLMRWFRVIWWDSPIIFAGLLAALPAHLRLGEPVPQSPVHQRPWNRDRHVTFLGVVNISRFGVVASFYLCLMAVELLYPHNLSCLNGNETMYIYIYIYIHYTHLHCTSKLCAICCLKNSLQNMCSKT